jgi:glycosyltransferase involved in cell wall biosynthesis
VKVAVLLSTFNSAKYLCAQIDSVLNQTYGNFELHIRDDGSSDETLEIVADYVRRDIRVRRVDDGGLNLRSAKSFTQLLSGVDADYYFFCDHDDVWLPTKIELSLLAIKTGLEERSTLPVLVATDLAVVDHQLNLMADSFANYSGIYPQLLQTFPALAATNYITGCTLAFNRVLRDKALKYSFENVEMHDHWLALVCMHAGGKIRYLPVPTILYRQHASNVVGAKAQRFPSSLLLLPESLKVLKRYIAQAKSINPEISASSIIAAKVAYRLKYLALRWL